MVLGGRDGEGLRGVSTLVIDGVEGIGDGKVEVVDLYGKYLVDRCRGVEKMLRRCQISRD